MNPVGLGDLPVVDVTMNDFGQIEKVVVDGILFNVVTEMSWKWKSRDLPVITFTIAGTLKINGKDAIELAKKNTEK